jgi:23S rRNA (guanine2445-N2)-methyltransferase / 23S rRNA (guanine2069-N7)-methyltransferase
VNPVLSLFIIGHKGFETLLFHEVRKILQDQEAKITRRYGGVEVSGSIECAYRLCLYSRLANRVFCQLKSFRVEDDEQLYRAIHDVDWSEHFSVRHSLAVSATLSRSNLDHTHYASLRVKDAIVDQFRERFDSRPMVDKTQPDIRIHLNIHRNQASLSLDLSGESLHRRGYRTEHTGAPLKEHLAASMLAHAGWTRGAVSTHRFIDPMCGSGTFAIEAAMIAANIAPGINRDYYGFNKWSQHDTALWQQSLDEAKQQIDHSTQARIFASDYDVQAIQVARANATRADVEHMIEFSHQSIDELPLEPDSRPGIIVCNPPYGERLQSEQGLASLYSDMGNGLRRLAPARLHIISPNPDLLHRLRLKRYFKKAVKNGPIECLLASFEITAVDAKFVPAVPDQTSKGKIDQLKASDREAIIPLLNRLQKNARHLGRWTKKNDISCYRVYDADLPEFSFALDVYQSEISPSIHWYHLQEYQAPKTIDPDKAEARIEWAKQAVKQVFQIDDEMLFCKTRKRQRGKQQYQKQDNQGELFQVREGSASLLINLSDYLDSGLFLDHRLTRARIFDAAKGKSVLNLFCYTGSASVQAALGGASRVLSVDMSATYLKWARENHAINQLVDESKYHFLRTDVIELLENPGRFDLENPFDLIFLDPPSFSNSAKMRQTLDIQRDHEHLIDRSMQLLAEDGLLIFSTNRKGFKLGDTLGSKYRLRDISRDTLPEDFKRKPGIHKCWEIRQKNAS